MCFEDPLAEDTTEERDSNFDPHSKTRSKRQTIRCDSQPEVRSSFWHNFVMMESR